MASLMLIILTSLIVFATARSTDICPTELRNCTCSGNRVNCDLRGYTILPEDVIMDLNILYFSFENNNLTSIGDKHLRNFIKMSHLNLRNNMISNITENAFFHNVGLLTVDLSHNRLKHLPKDLFERLDFLETIYLQHNELTRIETDHFGHIITLQRVRLSNNRLTYVGKDAFVNSEGLIELYLEFNNLEIPEQNWLIHFKHSTIDYEVYLDNNPWSCDCRMKEFYEWAKHNPWFLAHAGRGVSVPECRFPPRLLGQRLAHISSSDKLICSAANITSEVRDIKTVEGQKIKIDCQATGSPPAEVSITNEAGKVLATSKGSISFTFNEVETADKGVYHCRASGFDKNAAANFQEKSFSLDVYRSPGHVVAVILISLLFAAIGLTAMVWFYKKKFGQKAQYGRLPNNSAYYDSSAIAASAKFNAQSIRGNPNGPTAPTSVSNPYNGEGENSADDDEEVIAEYSKDTEFLV